MFQRGAFFPQLLGVLGIIPDLVVSQLQFYFSQSFLSIFIVKDTP